MIFLKKNRSKTAAITGAYKDSDLFDRVTSILKMGFISTETRFENQLDMHGLGGSGIDFWSGGADSVFTQMFTQKNIEDHLRLRDLMYNSKVRFLLKLDALETGSYQYKDDALGVRKIENDFWFDDEYAERQNILEFTNDLQKNTRFANRYNGHEVMFKERLAPSFIQGLVVDDQSTYNNLLHYLRDHNMIQIDPNGNETILNTAVDQFIRIGTQVTDQLLVPS